jgi:2-Cys peroxiredoxin 5
VLVYCVNDAAVMAAWAEDQGVKGSMVSFLADTSSELTKALGVVLDDAGVMSALGNPRCKRFACFIDDGVIKSFFISEGPDE